MGKKKKACSKLVEGPDRPSISFWMRSGHPSFVDEAPED
jgi:hypothetical protein